MRKEAAQLTPAPVAGTSQAEAATWATMARMLMNLDELVTRE
jgi:hypothetical protein